MNALATIEHHPRNVGAPWVVITRGPVRLWFAYRTRREAEGKLTSLPLAGFMAAVQALKGANDE